MLANKGLCFKNKTEQTRVLMSDYRSLKDEFELLKERRERKESPKVDRRTEGKMPEPETLQISHHFRQSLKTTRPMSRGMQADSKRIPSIAMIHGVVASQLGKLESLMT